MKPKILLEEKINLTKTQRNLLQTIIKKELDYFPSFTELSKIINKQTSTIYDAWRKLELDNEIVFEISITKEGIESPSEIIITDIPVITSLQRKILKVLSTERVTITYNKKCLSRIMDHYVSNIWGINERINEENIFNSRIIIRGRK